MVITLTNFNIKTMTSVRYFLKQKCGSKGEMRVKSLSLGRPIIARINILSEALMGHLRYGCNKKMLLKRRIPHINCSQVFSSQVIAISKQLFQSECAITVHQKYIADLIQGSISVPYLFLQNSLLVITILNNI